MTVMSTNNRVMVMMVMDNDPVKSTMHNIAKQRDDLLHKMLVGVLGEGYEVIEAIQRVLRKSYPDRDEYYVDGELKLTICNTRLNVVDGIVDSGFDYKEHWK